MPEHSELLAMLSAEYGIAPNDIMARCDRCNSTDLTLSEFLDGHMLHCNSCGHGMLVRRDP